MPLHGNKQKITLTINPETWQRCKALGKTYDVNWSEVAEQTFDAFLVLLEQLEQIRRDNPDGASLPLLKAELRRTLAQNTARAENEINFQFHPDTEPSKPKAAKQKQLA